MDGGLRTSASGMRAQQLRVDTIANNLANVNTTAFKHSRATFQDVLYETLQGQRSVNYAGASSLNAVQIGRGVRLASVLRVDTQGPLETTDRPLDLAIEGAGFFQVQLPDGNTAFTRDGTLTISDTGQLVTSGGYALIPGISVPPEATQVTVSPSGVVSAIMGTNGQQSDIGQIELARFPNPTGLFSLGENLYQQTAASGEPIEGTPYQDAFGRIVQGALEGSNVEIVEEMVEMIAAQRAYEINAKAITTAESMIDATNNLVR